MAHTAFRLCEWAVVGTRFNENADNYKPSVIDHQRESRFTSCARSAAICGAESVPRMPRRSCGM
jgi:hypothetical protein